MAVVTAPDFNATTDWAGGGFDPSATVGGYDPNNPGAYLTTYNSVGGQAAVSQTSTGAPSYAGGYYGDQVETGGGGYSGEASNINYNSIGGAAAVSQNYDMAPNFDPSAARSSISGFQFSGTANADTPVVSFASSSSPTSTASTARALDNDWRVKLSLADNSKLFYNDSANKIMAPLLNTGGVVFPYTPQISVTHQAIYEQQGLTHSNYASQFYNRSEVADITVTGDFTVQTATEGAYLLAVVYFLRSATKMFFGQDSLAGNPPPMVFLNGYGKYYFPNVPCVVSQFQHTLGADVDYLQDLNATRLPAISQIQVTLKPVYSRKNIHDNFTLQKFASGALLGATGQGGFL